MHKLPVPVPNLGTINQGSGLCLIAYRAARARGARAAGRRCAVPSAPRFRYVYATIDGFDSSALHESALTARLVFDVRSYVPQ